MIGERAIALHETRRDAIRQLLGPSVTGDQSVSTACLLCSSCVRVRALLACHASDQLGVQVDARDSSRFSQQSTRVAPVISDRESRHLVPDLAYSIEHEDRFVIVAGTEGGRRVCCCDRRSLFRFLVLIHSSQPVLLILFLMSRSCSCIRLRRLESVSLGLRSLAPVLSSRLLRQPPLSCRLQIS